MFSPEDLQSITDRALEAADKEMNARTHANYDQRARRFMRLADASDALHAQCIRDTHYEMWGPPPDLEQPREGGGE